MILYGLKKCAHYLRPLFLKFQKFNDVVTKKHHITHKLSNANPASVPVTCLSWCLADRNDRPRLHSITNTQTTDCNHRSATTHGFLNPAGSRIKKNVFLQSCFWH